MKVRIINAGEVTSFCHMWYADKVGEEYEAAVDENFPNQYYFTMLPIKGRPGLEKHHIHMCDCEITAH